MKEENTEKTFQDQILDIMEVFQQNKDNPQNIETLLTCIEELSIISNYISIEFNKQSIIYGNNRSEYYYNVGQRKSELMKLDKVNNKKMTSAYADTLADQENKEYKRNYVKAEGIKEGLKQISYQIHQNISIIESRISYLKMG